MSARGVRASIGLFVLLFTAEAASSQESQTGLRLGGVRLNSSASIAPQFDSNVNNDRDRNGDWATTSLLSVEAGTRVGIAGIRLKSGLDTTYYNTYAERRSVGEREEVQGEFYLDRLRPFVAQSFGNIRTPFSVEIDLPVRRVELESKAGADLRITALTTLRGQVDRRAIHFAHDAVYRGESLTVPLNYVSNRAQLALFRDLTPLTKLSVTGEILSDRFKFEPLRDSKSHQLAVGVLFQPDALISGAATVGYRRLVQADSHAPPFTGMVGSADLSYILLGGTRVNVRISRDVPYSLSADQPYFVSSMLGASVTQAFGDNWEVEGAWRGDRMAYRALNSRPEAVELPAAVGPRTDYVLERRLAVRRHLNPRLRVGVNFQTTRHRSPDPRYVYGKSIMGTTIIYAF